MSEAALRRSPGPSGAAGSSGQVSLGLYVHVPFCARACPYCDFDFEVGRRPGLDARLELYFDALERELRERVRDGEARRPVDSVYIGGGTPSSLGAQGLRRVFELLDRHVDRTQAREVTVELNPEHVDAALLDALAAANVDRVSLGVQSLGTAGLAQLGRVHDAGQALDALRACSARFACTLDLIVGWPGQRAAGLEATLARLLDEGIEHVSVYALTIEPNSAWPALVRRGQRSMPDPDGQAPLLEQVCARLEGADFEHYEVASYAKAGAAALHNQKYWTGCDYIGVGPSAHSATHLTREGVGGVRRRGNPRGLDAWAGGEAATCEELTGDPAAGEALWLALRRLAGVPLASLQGRFPQIDRDWVQRRAPRSFARGNLQWSSSLDNHLSLGPGRWLWHDAVGEELV